MNRKQVEAFLETFSKKGDGKGYYFSGENKKFIEIPFSLPGEKVVAQIIGKKGKQQKGALIEILQPSSSRIKPKCIHFGTCGGCRWQHLDYPEQCLIKEQWVKKLFSPFVHSRTKWHPIIPSKNLWQYRNKMEFTFSQDRAGERYLGLIQIQSKGKVENLQVCHLVHPWQIEVVKKVRQWWTEENLSAYHPPSNTGTLESLTLREGIKTKEKMVILTVSGNPDFALNKKQIQRFAKKLEKENASLFLRIHQRKRGSPTRYYEMHLAGSEVIYEEMEVGKRIFRFQISPQAFFQPNTLQAETIYQRVLDLSEPKITDRVLDLFCGIGTLGLVFAPHVKRVVGIELSREAILDAKENAKQNGIESIEFFQGDVSEVLKENPFLTDMDLLILDPPRSGLEKNSIERIKALKAKKIAYISCNPFTQVRDIEDFLQEGYSISDVQPLDPFPQTYHLENIVILKKR